MELEPEAHLEDWEEKITPNGIEYTLGILKVVLSDINKKKDLYIKSSNGIFNHIKEINNFWELMSYNTFMNPDIVTDQENIEFQIDLLHHLKDNIVNFEYLIVNKNSGHTFGVNNLIDVDGWKDKSIETLWNKGDLIVIDVLDNVDPKILTNQGWKEIPVNHIESDLRKSRNDNIDSIF